MTAVPTSQCEFRDRPGGRRPHHAGPQRRRTVDGHHALAQHTGGGEAARERVMGMDHNNPEITEQSGWNQGAIMPPNL